MCTTIFSTTLILTILTTALVNTIATYKTTIFYDFFSLIIVTVLLWSLLFFIFIPLYQFIRKSYIHYDTCVRVCMCLSYSHLIHCNSTRVCLSSIVHSNNIEAKHTCRIYISIFINVYDTLRRRSEKYFWMRDNSS